MLGVAVWSLAAASGWTFERIRREIAFPYQLDAEEGHLLNQALRLSRGESLYGPIERPPYVVENYPPLFPALWSLLARQAGPSLAPGRWITAVSAVVAALAVAALVFAVALEERRRVGSPPGSLAPFVTLTLLAAAAAGLVFLSSRSTLRWVAYTRVDMPALALTLCGLAFFACTALGPASRATGPGRIVAAALLALALLTKQTTLAAPVACCVALAAVSWRRAFRFGLYVVVLAALPTMALCVATDWRYWLHTVTYNRNIMYWAQLPGWFWLILRLYFPLLAALGVVCLWLASEEVRGFRTRRRGASPQPAGILTRLVAPYFALNALSLVTLAKAGAAENYLLEPAAAAAVFLGATLTKAWQCGGPERSRVGHAAAHGVVLIVAAALLWHGVRFGGLPMQQGAAPRSGGKPAIAELLFQTAPRGTFRAVTEGNRLVKELRRTPGPVLCEDPVYALKAGKPVVFQHFIMCELAREGWWDEAPFVQRVASGKFSRVVALDDLSDDQAWFSRYTPPLRHAILAANRLSRRVDRGRGLQPFYVYEPRGSAESPAPETTH